MTAFNEEISEEVIVSNGVLILGGVRLDRFRVSGILGKGANGVVFDAHHEMLNQPRALKVWLKLRVGDSRDKFVQGIAEAQKLAAADSKWVALVYDADRVGGVFYSAMEKVPGITLRKSIAASTTKIDRWWLARLYMNCIAHTTSESDAHGDPHAGNAMVYDHAEGKYDGGTRIKLLDFGTSHFAGPVFSRSRHWKIVYDTFCEIIEPFDSRQWALNQGMPYDGREDFLKAAYFDDVLDGLKIEAGFYPKAPPVP